MNDIKQKILSNQYVKKFLDNENAVKIFIILLIVALAYLSYTRIDEIKYLKEQIEIQNNIIQICKEGQQESKNINFMGSYWDRELENAKEEKKNMNIELGFNIVVCGIGAVGSIFTLIKNKEKYLRGAKLMDKKDLKTLVILTLGVIAIISFFVFGDIGKNKQEYINYRKEEKEYEEQEQASLITYMKVSNESIINQGTSYKYPHYYFVGELKNTYTKAVKGGIRVTFYNGSSIVHTETIFLPNDGLSSGETFNFECSIGDKDIKYTRINYSDSSLRTKY